MSSSPLRLFLGIVSPGVVKNTQQDSYFEKLHASVGASMEAMQSMQSLASVLLYPDRVSRLICIPSCARSHPYSIALRNTRQVSMADPNWNKGIYYHYHLIPPHIGMKLAREIVTISYRSEPE